MPPTFGNGKICYIEIPALDIEQSAIFYEKVFGWSLRRRDDGSISFDDGVGEVSGTWITGRQPATEPGFVISIMVDNAVATIDALKAAGAEIVKPLPEKGEKAAWFRDPAGNVAGIYQHGG